MKMMHIIFFFSFKLCAEINIITLYNLQPGQCLECILPIIGSKTNFHFIHLDTTRYGNTILVLIIMTITMVTISQVGVNDWQNHITREKVKWHWIIKFKQWSVTKSHVPSSHSTKMQVQDFTWSELKCHLELIWASLHVCVLFHSYIWIRPDNFIYMDLQASEPCVNMQVNWRSCLSERWQTNLHVPSCPELYVNATSADWPA